MPFVMDKVSKGAKIRNRYNQVQWKDVGHTILRIGIIRALNESEGGLFRAPTQHRQNNSDNQGANIRNRYNQVQWKGIVHTILKIGIIRAFNESAGRLFRVATQHRQNNSYNQGCKDT